MNRSDGLRASVPYLLVFAAMTSPLRAIQEVRREPVVPSPASPNATDAFPLVDPPADGVPAIVVDAKSGEPVSGALITWFEQIQAFEPRVLPDAALQQERIEHGRTVRSDAHGLAMIGRGALIIASAGDRFAAREWSRGAESPLRLVLKSARHLEVVVVDAGQRPLAGVPIALAEREGSQGSARSWTVRTGADGRASIGPLDLFIERELEHGHSFFVRADAALGGDFEQELDGRSPPDKPVTIVLPSLGRLVIDLVDEKGEPFQGEHYVSVKSPRDADPTKALDPANEWFTYDRTAHYELPCAAIARALLVEASDYDDHEFEAVTIAAPTSAGATVSVKLVPKAHVSSTITALVTDRDQKPLVDASLTLQLRHEKSKEEVDDSGAAAGLGSRIDATSDASGRVRFKLKDGRWDKSSAVEEVAHAIAAVVEENSERDGVVARGEFALGASDKDGVRDLGKVALEPTPVALSGRVVDDAGRPVAGATVTIEATEREKEKDEPVFRSGSFSAFQTLSGRSRTDGLFELHGPLFPDVDYAVRVGPPTDAAALMEYADTHESVQVHFGDSGVDLVLWRAGTIVGTILGDRDEFEQLSFHVSWRREDGVESGFWGGDPAATFEFSGIPIGVATVELERRGSYDDVVARIEKIELKPGEVTRLPPIDLASVSHSVTLTIRDSAGKPVPEGWITMPDKSEASRVAEMMKMFADQLQGGEIPFDIPRTPPTSNFKNGAITLRGVEPFHVMAVGATGFAAQVLRDVEGPVVVTLRPAPKVSLVLDLEGDGPPEGLELIATFAPENGDPTWFRFGPGPMSHGESSQRMEPVTLVRDKEIPFNCTATGRLHVGVLLGRRQPGGYTGRGISSVPRVIKVADTLEPQVFHVRIDPDDLRAAVEASRQDRSDDRH